MFTLTITGQSETSRTIHGSLTDARRKLVGYQNHRGYWLTVNRGGSDGTLLSGGTTIADWAIR